MNNSLSDSSGMASQILSLSYTPKNLSANGPESISKINFREKKFTFKTPIIFTSFGRRASIDSSTENGRVINKKKIFFWA